MFSSIYYQIAGWHFAINGDKNTYVLDNKDLLLFSQHCMSDIDASLSMLALSSKVPVSISTDKSLRQHIEAEITSSYDILDELDNDAYQFNLYSGYAFSYSKLSMRVFSYLANRAYLHLSVPLMYLLANYAAIKDGIMLHGAGGVIDGKSFAILGIPGAGKSTSIAMIQHDFLLSDDLLVARVTEINTPILYSTPLGSNTDGNISAPLTTIFFPVKSNEFKLVKLSKLQSIERFYASQSGYWNKVFKPYRKKYFEKVVSILDKVQTFEMHFSKEYIDNKPLHACVKGKVLS